MAGLILTLMDNKSGGGSSKFDDAIRDARQRLTEAEQGLRDQQRLVEALRNYLRELTGAEENADGQGAQLPYVNMKIHKAILKFLGDEGRTEEEIIDALREGGAVLGKVNPAGQIKKSIGTNVKVGRLRRDEQGLIWRGPKSD